jgi:hypothetical protein
VVAIKIRTELKIEIKDFASNIYILYLISRRDIFSINGLTMILKFIGQHRRQPHYDITDKNNNVCRTSTIFQLYRGGLS